MYVCIGGRNANSKSCYESDDSSDQLNGLLGKSDVDIVASSNDKRCALHLTPAFAGFVISILKIDAKPLSNRRNDVVVVSLPQSLGSM